MLRKLEDEAAIKTAGGSVGKSEDEAAVRVAGKSLSKLEHEVEVSWKVQV